MSYRARFTIDHPGEEDAGIISYSEIVVVRVMSGNPGGDNGEFADFIRDCLAQWFDGAKVIIVAEGKDT